VEEVGLSELIGLIGLGIDFGTEFSVQEIAQRADAEQGQ
jgi:hypothetical protein